mmetsp:Transcript_9140/g.20191  ORF Transcript_9140/g.20191 Transcript_9140/m.20191 type:complete len:177 (-) Transcript_9140:193-723(-)
MEREELVKGDDGATGNGNGSVETEAADVVSTNFVVLGLTIGMLLKASLGGKSDSAVTFVPTSSTRNAFSGLSSVEREEFANGDDGATGNGSIETVTGDAMSTAFELGLEMGTLLEVSIDKGGNVVAVYILSKEGRRRRYISIPECICQRGQKPVATPKIEDRTESRNDVKRIERKK